MTRSRAAAALMLAPLAACTASQERIELPDEARTTLLLVTPADGEPAVYAIDRERPIPALPRLDDATSEVALAYDDAAAALGMTTGRLALADAGAPLPSLDRARVYRLSLSSDPMRWLSLPAVPDEIAGLRLDPAQLSANTAGCLELRSRRLEVHPLAGVAMNDATFAVRLRTRVWVGFTRAPVLVIDAAGKVAAVTDSDGQPVVASAAALDRAILWMVSGGMLLGYDNANVGLSTVGAPTIRVALPTGSTRWLEVIHDYPAPGDVGVHGLGSDGVWWVYAGGEVHIASTPECGFRGAHDVSGGLLADRDAARVYAGLDDGEPGAPSRVCIWERGVTRRAPVDLTDSVIGVDSVLGFGVVIGESTGRVHRIATAHADGVTLADGEVGLGRTFIDAPGGFWTAGVGGAIRQWRNGLGWCPTRPAETSQTVQFLEPIEGDVFLSTGTIPDGGDPDGTPIVLHTIVR